MTFCAALVAACLALAGSGTEPPLTKTQIAELAQYFGFGPLQIYKLKPGIAQLRLADLNGDGRTDIALWNGHQSRFELFFQPDPAAPPDTAPAGLERNEIPNRGTLLEENVPVAYRVAVMDIADLTADSRPDLVFFGEPREVVILPGLADGGFGPPVATRAPEGEPRGGALALGDFNHDGRKDVALLGPDVLLIFHQKAGGALAKPVRIVHGIRQPGLMLAADLNGDGRDDLAVGADDEQYGMYVCLQEAGGALNALQRVKMPKVRSMTFARAAGGDDLFAIEASTGHLKHYRWAVPPHAAAGADWPLRLHSYPFKIRSRRIPCATGDLTGDGRPDFVTADPDSAQFILYEGTPRGLSAGIAFPALMRTTDLAVADLDGDGRSELLSVSAEEQTLGLSSYTESRVSFPKPLKIDGDPLAVAVGPLRTSESRPCLAYVARTRPATATAEAQAEAVEEPEPDEEEGEEGTPVLIRLVDPATQQQLQSWECTDLSDEPSGLRFADVNQDGRNDLMLLVRFGTPQVYIQGAEGSFRLLSGPDVRSALIRGAAPETFALEDVTGDGKPEVLVAQKGLARALVVQDGRWTVVDQYNPDSADAEITGLAALPPSRRVPTPEGRAEDRPALPDSPALCLYDRKARDLLVLNRREDKTYAVAQSVPVGNFDLSAMLALPLENGRPGLLLADASKLAVLTPGEVAPTLVQQEAYETDVKDAYLADAVVGDLNHDGVRDLALVDMRKAGIEILTTDPSGGYVRATRFQVFQGKRFSGDPTAFGEPREVLIADVTGDRRDDLVLLVHDRLLIYPGQ